MDIYLSIDGQQKGPYTEDQVRQSLTDGLISPDLPAWHDGLTAWVQIQSLVERPHSVATDEASKKLQRSKADVALTPENILPAEESKPQPRRRTLKYVGIGSAIFTGLLVLGVSIGAGIGLVHTAGANAHASQIVVTERPYVPPDSNVNPPSFPNNHGQADQSAAISLDGGVAVKGTYINRDSIEGLGEVIMLEKSDGTGRIAVYDLPKTLAEGDSWEGTLYPAGFWMDSNIKFHAYSTDKKAASGWEDNQKSYVKHLQEDVAMESKGIRDWDALIQEYKATGADASSTIKERDLMKSRLQEDIAKLKPWE